MLHGSSSGRGRCRGAGGPAAPPLRLLLLLLGTALGDYAVIEEIAAPAIEAPVEEIAAPPPAIEAPVEEIAAPPPAIEAPAEDPVYAPELSTTTLSSTTHTGAEFAVSGFFTLTVPDAASFLSACDSDHEVQYGIQSAISALVNYTSLVPADVRAACSAPALRRRLLDEEEEEPPRELRGAAGPRRRRLVAGAVQVSYEIETRAAFANAVRDLAAQWFQASATAALLQTALEAINAELGASSSVAPNLPTAITGGSDPTIGAVTTTTTMTTGTSVTTMTTATSSTTSTSTTLAADAAVAAEAAAAERAVVGGLFSGSPGGGGGGGPVVVSSAVGVVTALVLEPEDAGQAVELSAPNSSVRVEVPQEVLAQVTGISGAVALLLTEFDDDAAGAFNETAPPDGSEGAFNLAGAPVSVTIYDDDGREVTGIKLATPILLTLLPKKVEGVQCAFFNESTGQWSYEGLEEVVHDGPELICATSHLTIFAAILAVVDEAGEVLACNNAHLLSKEGLDNVGKSEWMGNPASIFLFTVLLAQTIMIVLAIHWDRQAKRAEKWDDANFFTSNSAHERRRGKAARKAVSKFGRLQDLGFVSKYCTYRAIAFMRRVAAADLEKLMKSRASPQRVLAEEEAEAKYQADEGPKDAAKAPSGAGREPSTCPLVVEVCDSAPADFEEFWSLGFRRRTAIIFASFQPWVKLRYFSISVSSPMRAMLLTARILGAMMFSAFFYLNSNDNVSADSSEGCQPNSLWEAAFRNVVVGMVSAFGSLCLIALVVFVKAPRNFVYREDWDDAARSRYLRRWMLRDTLLWVVMSAYATWCFFFLCVFLANMSAKTGLHWLTAAGVGVAKELVMAPLFFAVVLSTVATLVHDRLPHVAKQVHQTLQVTSSKPLGQQEPGTTEKWCWTAP